MRGVGIEWRRQLQKAQRKAREESSQHTRDLEKQATGDRSELPGIRKTQLQLQARILQEREIH